MILSPNLTYVPKLVAVIPKITFNENRPPLVLVQARVSPKQSSGRILRLCPQGESLIDTFPSE